MFQFDKVIDDPRAPARLKGKTVHVSMTAAGMALRVNDLPDDVTAQETGYIHCLAGEIVDALNREFPGILGEPVVSVVPQTPPPPPPPDPESTP